MARFKTKVILLVDPIEFKQNVRVLGVFTDFALAYKKLAEIRSSGYPNSYSLCLELSDIFLVSEE